MFGNQNQNTSTTQVSIPKDVSNFYRIVFALHLKLKSKKKKTLRKRTEIKRFFQCYVPVDYQ